MPPSSAAGNPPPPGSGPSTAASCVPVPVPVPVDGIPLSDRLLGMRRKEAGLYRAGDYFDRLRFLSARAEEAGLVGANGDAYVEELDSAVIEDRRERTCEWIFLVVDRCHSDRQVAEVAVSFLDRYVSSVVFRGEAADEGLRQAPPQPAPKPIPEAAEGSQPPLKRRRSFTALQEAGGSPAAPAATDIRVPAPPPAARSVTVTVTAPTSPSTPPLPAGAAAREADLPPAPTASHLRAVIEALSVTSFHLATLTALYLAMKLYEPRKIRLDRLACLSRGNFAAEDVAAMERRMLSSLAWAVHPPTRIDFLASFCGLLPAAAPVGPPASSPGAGADDGAVNADLYELARFFVELSVWDARFVHLDPSAAALGALFNAMGMIGEGRFPPSRKEAFLAALSAAAPGLFEVEGTEMDAVRARLDVVFEHSTEASSNGHEKFLRDLSAASSSSSSSGTGDGPTPSSSSSAHPAAPEESEPETHPEKILTRESPVGVADLGMVGAVSP